MADVWTCANCTTVNGQNSNRCMACMTFKTVATAAVVAETEAPATMVSAVAPPIRPGSVAAAPVTPAAGSRPSSTSTTRLSPRTTMGPVAPVTRPVPPSAPPAPTATPGRTSTRPGRRRSRYIATGKLLGIGHIGMFITAILIALTEFSFGRDVLRWANHPTIANHVSGWWANPIIRDTFNWSNDLPWGAANWPYLTLGIACLVMRLWRRLSGPLSLLIALPAALYGILAGVSELPYLVALWPVGLATLIISWVVVGKTIR